MEHLRDRVAVVTGGASGIGLAMARRFAAEGMRLVIADIDADRLGVAAADLRRSGTRVTDVVVDVSRAGQVQSLADLVFDEYGHVAVLCNNAGVTKRARAWELTVDDWTWVLGVDLWSVIHGVRSFVPRMIAQGSPGHVVNTASMTGLLPMSDVAAYAVAKSGVVSLSECLQIELTEDGTDVRVSVLAPGFIATNIAQSGRHRPPDLGDTAVSHRPRSTPGLEPQITADELATQVLEAVRQNRFWILTHPDYRAVIRERATGIGTDAQPASFAVW